MLIDINKSCLMVVDVQEKLTPLVNDADRLINNCQWLIRLAKELDVKRFVTEQYPKGLGGTVASLGELLEDVKPLDKVHFSVMADDGCRNAFNALNKSQAILIGIETSVCILQTALDLVNEGNEVFVVVDCVSARLTNDHKYALKRMRDLGCTLVTREMVFFEWLRKAGGERFKQLSQQYLR